MVYCIYPTIKKGGQNPPHYKPTTIDGHRKLMRLKLSGQMERENTKINCG